MNAYPQLPMSAARTLVAENEPLPVFSEDSLLDGVFYPEFGIRVGREDLLALRREVLQLQAKYPPRLNNVDGPHFDRVAARMLHQALGLTIVQASELTLWVFFTCRLFPDVVSWRWRDTPDKRGRFIGSAGGSRKNAIGSLWWTAEVLSSHGDYSLLEEPLEDLVRSVVERSGVLMRCPALARTIVQYCLAAKEMHDSSEAYRAYYRARIKKLRFVLPMVEFGVLNDQELHSLVHEVFRA